MITARYKTRPVEILDVFESGGVKYASIRALAGRPFVAGTHYPIKTEYTTVEAAQLSDITRDNPPAPTQPNLLALALACKRDQWPECTTIWLVSGNGKQRGAFLKASEGFVTLNITHYEPSLRVFVLDLLTGEWKQARNLEAKYKAWAAKAREAVR